MSFIRYCSDRFVSIIIMCLAVVIVSLVLYVSGMDVSVIVFVGALVILAFLAALVYDYLYRRRFFTNLLHTLESLEQRYLLSEVIERPSFLEGELAYDALEGANKDMNDAIAAYRIQAEEYREYIETWIHEIKTPIAAARLTIENNRCSETRVLEGEVDRIEGYVEQALYYARSLAVEKDYHIREVVLESLAKGAVRKQARLLIECGMTPSFDKLDCVVYADTKWLDFILGQLITNAVRYRCTSASRTPTIKFSCEQLDTGLETACVILHVTDNGIGIAAEDLPRVFEKGFTGSNGRSYAKSTGMGLYLVKNLCEKMGLSVGITSQPGEFTDISITFPLNRMYFLE